jgi:hypothetical protein
VKRTRALFWLDIAWSNVFGCGLVLEWFRFYVWGLVLIFVSAVIAFVKIEVARKP